MAKFILLNASVVANSQDLSNHVESVELDIEVDDVDLTAMGATAREHGPGLRNDTCTINFFQDFAASSVDATFWPLIGVQAGFPLVIKPTAAAVSSTNPSFTGTGILLTYSPLAGSVGEASMTSIEIPYNGAVVRATV